MHLSEVNIHFHQPNSILWHSKDSFLNSTGTSSTSISVPLFPNVYSSASKQDLFLLFFLEWLSPLLWPVVTHPRLAADYTDGWVMHGIFHYPNWKAKCPRELIVAYISLLTRCRFRYHPSLWSSKCIFSSIKKGCIYRCICKFWLCSIFEWYLIPCCPYIICCSLATKSCPTLLWAIDYNLPGSSIHEISQARILEQVAISLLQGIFPTWGSNLCFLWLLHWQV